MHTPINMKAAQRMSSSFLHEGGFSVTLRLRHHKVSSGHTKTAKVVLLGRVHVIAQPWIVASHEVLLLHTTKWLGRQTHGWIKVAKGGAVCSGTM